jgi:asparagine synthase (glutamine-hydrolysing)
MKLRGFTTKWLLKTAMENRLPPGIAQRKKQGFSIPMKNWIRGDLLEFTHDTVFSSGLVADYFDVPALRGFWREHQQRRSNHSHLFWTLLNLSIWERLFLSGTQSMLPARTMAQASS